MFWLAGATAKARLAGVATGAPYHGAAPMSVVPAEAVTAKRVKLLGAPAASASEPAEAVVVIATFVPTPVRLAKTAAMPQERFTAGRATTTR